MVCVFENCGEAVGVTMPHPHGQIYAIPFIAPIVEKEIESARLHAEANHGECLFCRLLEEEIAEKSRVVSGDEYFMAFVPFAARFPAEVALYARRHVRTLLDLTIEEKQQSGAEHQYDSPQIRRFVWFYAPAHDGRKTGTATGLRSALPFSCAIFAAAAKRDEIEIFGYDGNRVWELSWPIPLRKKWRRICECASPKRLLR